MNQETRPSLARVLSARDIALLVVGTVIGSGIWLVPAAVLRNTGGSVSLAFTVWIAAGILSILGAFTFAELGAMYPEAGGLYVYLRDTFGPLTAFLFGWTMFLCISSGSVATLAAGFTRYLGELVPVGPWTARLVPVAMISVIAVVNVLGTRRSATLQNWSTGFKAGAVVLMAMLLLLRGRTAEAAAAAAVDPPGSLLAGAGLALVAVLWAYEGWQYVSYSVGETLDPQKSFPRGILVGTAAIMAVYLLANWAYVVTLGPARAAGATRIAAESVAAAFGPGAGRLIALAILVSIFSAAHAVTLTSPRVYFAMARDGVFFDSLAQVHPRFGTPATAIVTSSLWAMFMAMTGTFEQLYTYVVFASWIFYALGALSVFVYRKTRPDAHRPFRVPGYPWTPLLFVLSAAAIVLNTLASQPRQALVGILIVLAGTPAFFLWKKRAARA